MEMKYGKVLQCEEENINWFFFSSLFTVPLWLLHDVWVGWVRRRHLNKSGSCANYWLLFIPWAENEHTYRAFTTDPNIRCLSSEFNAQFLRAQENEMCWFVWISTLRMELDWQDRVYTEDRERERERDKGSTNHTSRAVALCFGLGSVVCLTPGTIRCIYLPFLFYFSPCPSSQNLLYSFHPTETDIRPPQVLWMGLWHSRWSQAEDTGFIPKQAYGKGLLNG